MANEKEDYCSHTKRNERGTVAPLWRKRKRRSSKNLMADVTIGATSAKRVAPVNRKAVIAGSITRQMDTSVPLTQTRPETLQQEEGSFQNLKRLSTNSDS
jgi:hypothetical protein